MIGYRPRVMCVAIFALLALNVASAQIISGDALKKVIPTSYFFAGQSAAVQTRNSVAFKSAGGHYVLAGFVDTSGYSTAIQEKYQGFFITETKITFDGSTLEPGEYGFGFKEGKFLVMNVAASDVFSVATKSDDQLKHPVPLKLEKDGDGYRLYAGKNYVAFKAE